MDMYMYYGASVPIGVLRTTTGSSSIAGGNQSSPTVETRQQSPIIPFTRTTSRSVGEINSKQEDSHQTTNLQIHSSSPFCRSFSRSFNRSLVASCRRSLRKHQSLKASKDFCQQRKSTEVFTPTISKVVHSTGTFWRASKRLFSSPKLDTSVENEPKMPTPKVISHDDAQISSGHLRKHHRQRTITPPSEMSKKETNVCEEQQQIDSSSNNHSSPFRSLPSAKKTLIALMKWPSPSSSTGANSNLKAQTPSSGRDKSNKHANIRSTPDFPNTTSEKGASKQYELSYDTGSISELRKDMDSRIEECTKDLNVSLRFLDNVVKKDKLTMLDGSASIVLDSVLKLLLILNEKRRRYCTPGNENQAILEAYNSVYHHLAALLKFADHLVVKNVTASKSERQETTQLCEALKNAVQDLLSVIKDASLSGQLYKNGPGSKSPIIPPQVDVRKSSLASSSSTSSSTADWAGEDYTDCGLKRFDNHFKAGHYESGNCQRGKSNLQKPIRPSRPCTTYSVSSNSVDRPISSVSSASSGCITSSTSKDSMCPPNSNFKHQQKAQKYVGHGKNSKDLSNGSCSPPSADSGIFSLNENGGKEGNYLLTNHTAVQPLSHFTGEDITESNSMNFLDDILAKLKLNGISTTTLQEKVNDHHHTADDDVETVTEEVEETMGDTKIIRRKIITRQKVRHQSVLMTTTTTHIPLIDSPDSNLMNLLISPVKKELNDNDVPWQRRLSKGDEIDDLKAIKSGHCNLIDRMKNQTSESLHKAYPMANYGNGQQMVELSSSSRPLNTKQSQQLVQHSASLQSFSRQMVVNGRVTVNEIAQKVDASAIKASKSQVFDENGRITECRGEGSYDECSYAVGDRNTVSVDCQRQCNEQNAVQRRGVGTKRVAPQPPPRLSKRNIVSSYVQLFGTGEPSNQADFRSSTLATYVQLRDRWNDHFEAHKRKAMTFQSVATPTSSSSNGAGAATSGRRGTNEGVSSASSSSSSPKSSFNRSSKTYFECEDDGEGRPIWLPRKSQDDYQSLVNILNINDYLKLPKQPALEASIEKKPLSFPAKLALTDLNLLDEIDVKDHVMCKKSSGDDGPEIRGGSVDALIVHATKTASDGFAVNSHSPNTNGHGFCYQEAFLTTYRTFCSPLELVKKLVYRYDKFNVCIDDSFKRKAAKNTFSLLVRVVDDLSTVEMNDDVVRLLSDFIYRMILDGELNFSRLLRQKLMERYKLKRLYASDEMSPLYSSVSASGTPGKSSNLVDFKASLLAEQFTFLDWYYFQKIELSEMLLWAQEQSEENSPNLTVFTEHFNKMSYWVRTRILEQTDQKERERIFAKFVKVMRHLRRLNNFNSCLALLSALDSGPIRRLEWPKTSSDSLNEHSSLIDSSQSFKTYRMALADSKPPCLPYIGLILQDLTFVHIGNPNFLPPEQCQSRRDIVNFAKRWQQYTILDNMRRFKAWPYNIKKNDQVLSFLNDFDNYISEDDMWEISERIKPRQQSNHVGQARRINLNQP